jgi:hypothetical protein
LLESRDAGLCRTVGTLSLWRGDSLTVATSGSAGTYALVDLDRLEISEGERSHRVLGGVLGFVAGAGITYLVLHSGGSTSPCDRSSNQDAMNSGECLGLTALGGVAGAGVGVVVGGFFQSERWDQVPLPASAVDRR